MSCDAVREWNGAVLLGEAPEKPPEEVARHLATCDRCAAEVEGARAAWRSLMDSRATPGPTKGGWRMVESRNWLGRAATVLLALGVGVAAGWGAGRLGAGAEGAAGSAAEEPASPDRAAEVARPVDTEAPGTAYLLLIRETPATADVVSRVGTDALVREYGEWADSLAEDRRLIGAEKLGDAGVRVSAAGTEEVDGAIPDAVSGYFLVRAPDSRTAIEIARRSPHVRYGGVVEVRVIDATGEGR